MDLMRYPKAILVVVAAVMTLAACTTTTPAPVPDNPGVVTETTAPPPPPTAPSGQPNPGAVTGTISWPDGNPAVNADVYFYDHEPQIALATGGWYDGTYKVEQLPADGSYSLGGCPCTDLTAYLYIPGTPGAVPDNGGNDCWIIMQDDSGSFTGTPANPGDVINWQARDMPCDNNYYVSDPTVVQGIPAQIDPAQNGGDYCCYGGSWQAAEARTSG
jgi:hypothetical protein